MFPVIAFLFVAHYVLPPRTSGESLPAYPAFSGIGGRERTSREKQDARSPEMPDDNLLGMLWAELFHYSHACPVAKRSFCFGELD